MTAIAAGVVSLSALTVSIYEAYLQRQEQRVAVWPIIEHWTSYSDDEFSISVANKGIGPAIVHDVNIIVGGESQKSWSGVFQESLGSDSDHYQQSMLMGNVMAPGDVSTIVSYSRQVNAAWQASQQMQMEICYCSVFGDCWTYEVDNLVGGRPMRGSTEVCTEQSDDEF